MRLEESGVNAGRIGWKGVDEESGGSDCGRAARCSRNVPDIVAGGKVPSGIRLDNVSYLLPL